MTSGENTRSVHGGVQRHRPQHSITTPIVHSAPFTFQDTADLNQFMFQQVWGGGASGGREEYSRDGSSTLYQVEQRLAALEGGEDALLFSSGMAAFTSVLLGQLRAGDHLILTESCYKHSRIFASDFLARYGVSCSLVPAGDYDALAAAIQPGSTRFIVSESPSNPFMQVVDFARIVEIAQAQQVLTLVDSTFGTPINQQPLCAGVDYVMHSATKYLGGHHDLLAGVIVGSKARIAQLKETRTMLGGVLSPEIAFLLERGLRTLALRVRQHNQNAQVVAEFLEQQPQVERVYYPGLPSHPDHALAKAQMSGFGGVVSFELKGDQASANRFLDALQIPYLAASLGGVESLIGPFATMVFYELEPEDRLKMGIKDTLIRFSVGLEDSEDLLADLEQALTQL